ncbi:hypothetical protein P3X46_012536 [Hevea brasiliensis]|uniref:EB1 C-terminal domain-containing protein n=1 Tax=Hevea brasiliensis TaxID=3981 RepID=A0ABQ9MAJ1_HEVBR|nr:hypothetical protein P3X46_012536 [Hevea brasiliensis]
MATKIGMMDSASFVGRSEILSWINSTPHLNLSKVEEACTGAVHCQLMDSVHPGIVAMHKVNFDAKNEYEMIQNYKVLQDVFNKLKISKITELKLSVDNLEKERDFYFAKLRDIEILCQCPEIEKSTVVAAIKKILYATDDNPSVVAEAQAMVSLQQKDALSPIVEASSEEKMNSDFQKRKCIVNLDVDATSITALSPRQRLSEATDVHCSGSSLVTY